MGEDGGGPGGILSKSRNSQVDPAYKIECPMSL